MIAFTVKGKPEPGGSKKGFVIKGHVVIADANKNAKGWKKLVNEAAVEAMNGKALLEGALDATFVFVLQRPKSSKRLDPTVRPDLTKLIRPAEDAMTGVVYRDDAQIVKQHASKVYTEGEPHMKVVIRHV